ncbi:LysR substrate-binding domain-containing protein [Nocardia sp. NPDC058058]|uniref:LysR substrate-binding domain-containing protein n=1 Tax=Nocardia sp. NPDC058058 TaxID=3346317 RepID=UPI0036DDC093
MAARPATGAARLQAIINHCNELHDPLPMSLHFTRSPAAAVRDQLADIALTCTTEDTDGLSLEELDEYPTLALLASTHPLAAAPELTLAELHSAPGFLADCPDLPLDELIAMVRFQNATILVTGDLSTSLDDQLRAIPVTDALTTVLCLAWNPEATHPSLTPFLKQARRSAYHR